MTHAAQRARRFLRLQLRDLAPGRRLRMRLALGEIERFAGGSSISVLDGGSEEGLLCLELARRHPGWTLVATDIASAPLRRGKAWAEHEGLRVDYVRADLQRPFGRGLFDVVTAMESLVEIPDDRAAIASLAGALRSGGLLVAQVPTADWTPALKSAEQTWRREARHGYTADELRSTLDEVGLDVVTIRPTFRRTVALAQDVRDRYKRRPRRTQVAMLPLMAAAVGLERRHLTWGPARALLVVARKR